MDVLDPIIVTGSPEGEQRHKSTATVMVIDEEQIKDTNTPSLTDLLATVGAGFFSEWTPGQTSINIRGGASDGQGKDYKGQVMVLINGRRAGTANLSKLSPNDIYRVEIMRGPNSVMYGSQAIGGIINIITRNGRNTSGGQVDVRYGASNLVQTHAQFAKDFGANEEVAIYVGGSFGRKDNYKTGKHPVEELNTQWKRYGGLADFNWRINDSNTLDFTVRSDGIYRTGFRGSGANYAAKEDRSNHSIDLVWEYNPTDSKFNFLLHNYMVLDVDNFKWATMRSGILRDHNKRELTILGTKFQPLIKLRETNDLRVGLDLEYSRLRSERYRLLVTGVQPFSPYDLNQSEKVLALYIEDTQRFFDDRFTIRAGIRQTYGWISSDPTPNMADQLLDTKKYDHTTWSVGLNFAATDFLSFRAGAATGFRSPTASETTGWASFLNTPNAKTYGNPNIKPETSLEYEAGMYAHGTGWFADLALFHNEIKDRIITKNFAPPSPDSMYVNNPGKIVLTGLELSSRINLDELYDFNGLNLSFGLYAAYNFKMDDKAKTLSATVNSTKPERMYQYQGSIFAQIGGDLNIPWSMRLTGVLRGPVWYNTEESLKIPAYEPRNTFVHRKRPFWIFNYYGEVSLTKSFTLYGGINNLFNKNYHPLFIAIDDGTQYLNVTNGGTGTSSLGRKWYVGLKYNF
jgi:vitamin B12 transporter